MLFRSNDTATTEIYTSVNTLSLHDALPTWTGTVPHRPPTAPPTAQFSSDDRAASSLLVAIAIAVVAGFAVGI